MVAPEVNIEALEKRLKQEKARKRLIDTRKRKIESKKKRVSDTRRKILVGAAILAQVERGRWPEDELLAMLDAALTRTDDRALFGLEPLPPTAAPEE